MPIVSALMGILALSGSMRAYANAPVFPTYTVAMTAYNAVPWQTDADPHITASGAFSNPEIIAARSRDLAEELPFGTIIEVVGQSETGAGCGLSAVAPSIGYRIIADTMNARYTSRIDILFGTQDTYITAGGQKNAARVMGICKDVLIRVVGQLDGVRVGKFPKTQKALAALVASGSANLAVR